LTRFFHHHGLAGGHDLFAKRLEIDAVSDQYLPVSLMGAADVTGNARSIGVAMVLTLFAFDLSAASAADVPLLAAIFADHVVLQRDRPIEVWGRATPGKEVTVALSGATQRATADAQGAWHVALPAQPAATAHAGGAHQRSSAKRCRRLVGDVWLCSGQSNMEFTVRNTLNAGNEVAQFGERQHSPGHHSTLRERIAARGLRRAARMEGCGARDHARTFRRLLLLRARIAEERGSAARSRGFVVGRHAHRNLDESRRLHRTRRQRRRTRSAARIRRRAAGSDGTLGRKFSEMVAGPVRDARQTTLGGGAR